MNTLSKADRGTAAVGCLPAAHAPSVDPGDIAITLRSRCRHVALTAPSVEAIADMLISGDGLLPADDAQWAASVSSGQSDAPRPSQARERRKRALGLARDAATPSRAYAACRRDGRVRRRPKDAHALTAGRNEAEMEELKTALGAGGAGKGTGTTRCCRRAQGAAGRQS